MSDGRLNRIFSSTDPAMLFYYLTVTESFPRLSFIRAEMCVRIVQICDEVTINQYL